MARLGAKPILVTVAGGIFMYSGIKGMKLSMTIRDLVSGKNPAKDAAMLAKFHIDPNSPEAQALASGAAPDPTIPPTPQKAITSSSGKNLALGRMLAATYGWTGKQFDALASLWNNESGWNNTAMNPSSGAYGIPQSLPATKMPRSAQPPPVGRSDPQAQILWGLRYIKERYGNPENAWAHELSVGWY